MTAGDAVPEDFREWPDIRTIDAPTVWVDSVAYGIAAASGRRVIVRVEQPGRGPLIYVHPHLVEAVNAWYRGLGASIAAAAATMQAPAESQRAREEEHVPALAVNDGLCQPCAAQLAWGVQAGFAAVHPPCEACAPLVASWETARLSGWRTPAGRLTSPPAWPRSHSDRRTATSGRGGE